MKPSSGDYHILPQNVKQKLHKISINLFPIKDLATKTMHDSMKTIFTRDLYALCTYNI